MASSAMNTYGDELPAGWQLCGGQYTIERYLNSGGFGITYTARDSLGRRVVIKECFPGALCCRNEALVRPRSRHNEAEFDAILELFEKEASALAALQHPYIVGVHQFFRDNGTAYMAMDLVEGQTLLDIIDNDPDRLTPDFVRALLLEVLNAVEYIHDNNILHRDISPDNILIDSDNLPVLIDFGAARQDATRVSRALSKILTVKDGYSPQEFYLAGSDQVYSSDLYALAATFYHVVSRQAPPSSHTRLAAAARDLPDPLVLLDDKTPGYDMHFVSAINSCLSIFPKDRLSHVGIWRDMVDQDRRKQTLLEEAAQDDALEARVARLVADFHKEFDASKARAGLTIAKTPKAEARPAQDTGMSDLAKALSSPDLVGGTPEDDHTEAEADAALSLEMEARPNSVTPRTRLATAVGAEGDEAFTPEPIASNAPIPRPRPVTRAITDLERPKAPSSSLARADRPLRASPLSVAPSTETEAKS